MERVRGVDVIYVVSDCVSKRMGGVFFWETSPFPIYANASPARYRLAEEPWRKCISEEVDDGERQT